MLLLHTHTATFAFGRHEAMAAAATEMPSLTTSGSSQHLETPKAWHYYDTSCTRGGHKYRPPVAYHDTGAHRGPIVQLRLCKCLGGVVASAPLL